MGRKGWALNGHDDFSGDDKEEELRERAERQRKESEAATNKRKQVGEYCVPFIPIQCPRCESKDNKIYKSDPPVRYHKCNNCDLNFKSVEKT